MSAHNRRLLTAMGAWTFVLVGLLVVGAVPATHFENTWESRLFIVGVGVVLGCLCGLTDE